MPERGAGSALAAAVDALREQGAAQLDPLRFHLIAALARRAAGEQGAVRERLDARLASRLDECRQRLARAGGVEPGEPDESPLAGLLRQLAELAGEATAPDPAAPTPPAELKALRQFRSTWSRLSVERQVAQAQQQAPRNAGPLNSHGLVLQAVEQMGAIAPAYLQRFMSQVDALLWLEQVEAGRAPPPRPATRGDGERRRKAARPPGD